MVWCLCVLAMLATLVGVGVPAAGAATTVVNFDPPSYTVGQSVTAVAGATFARSAVVYAPTRATASAPNAVRAAETSCGNPSCSSGANELQLSFAQGLNTVSMSVGAANGGTEFCFPEGTTCPVWARLVAFDATGTPVDDSRDVLVSQFGVPEAESVVTTMTVADPSARIRSVKLSLGKGLFNEAQHAYGNPAPFAIDNLRLSTPDTPPPPPPPPPAPPSVQITGPAPGALIPYPYSTPLQGSVTAPAGLFGFCIRLNDPSPPAPQQCNQGGLVRPDGTFSVPLSTLRPRPGVNVVYVFAYDIPQRLGSADRSFQLGVAPGPTVTIGSPAPGSVRPSETDPVGVGAHLVAPGEIAGFCVTINNPAIPAAGACTRVPPVGQRTDYHLFDSIPAAQFGRGENEVRVTLYDRFGQRATDTVRFNFPADLRIVGIELTQGIQSRKGFVQPYYPGVGLVDSAADLPGPGAFTQRHSYQGTRLVLRGKTVLRIFVNQDGPGTQPGSAVRLLIEAAVPRLSDGSLRPIGGLVIPDSAPSQIVSGPAGLTVPVRGQPLAAYTFTLPRAWHEQIAQAPGGRLELRVKVIPSFSRPECTGCKADNQVILSGMEFGASPMDTPIHPVEVVFRDAKGTLHRPSPADEIFKDLEQIVPHTADGLRVTPFIGQVDATDLITARTSGAMTPDQVQSAIFGRVADFARGANPPSRRVIGVMAPGIAVRGVEAPVTYCCDFKGVVLPRWEPIAIAEQDRPMRSLLHEHIHQYGFYHAGLYCGADLAIGWPPDNQGRLQGFGLDRRDSRKLAGNAYRLITPTEASPFFDVMSYCGSGEDDVWISPQNWNAFGSAFPNGLLPDSIFLGQSTATITPSPPAGLRAQPRGTNVTPTGPPPAKPGRGIVTVSAKVHPDGRVRGLQASYTPGRGYAYAPRQSPYSVVVYGPHDRVVARSLLYAPPGADESGLVRGLEGAVDVPQQVTRLTIFMGSKQLATLRIGPAAPQVRLIAPRAGTRIRGTGNVLVQWSARDTDYDKLVARLEYAPDGRNFRLVASGLTGGSARLPAALLTASNWARLRLVVSDGYHETAVTSGFLRTTGPKSALRIVSPASDTTLRARVPFSLIAQQLNLRGQPIQGVTYRWYVNSRRVARGRVATLTIRKAGRYVLSVTATKGGSPSMTDRVIVVVKK
jgi:hypothetical protein